MAKKKKATSTDLKKDLYRESNMTKEKEAASTDPEKDMDGESNTTKEKEATSTAPEKDVNHSESIYKIVSKKDYDIVKARIIKLKSSRKNVFFISLLMSILFTLTIEVFYWRHNQYFYFAERKPSLGAYIILGIGCFIVMFVVVYLTFTIMYSSRTANLQAKMDIYDFANMQDKVEENLFESSLKMSYKYLDQYYYQTREQAKKGFLITVAVTIAGALSLFIGIGFMFFNKIDASKITIASGVIVEFISAIMFYFYNRTVQSMGNYHDKLFLSQNVATALKISDSLSDDKKDDIKAEIARELIKDVNAYIVTSYNKNDENKKKE